MSGPYMHTCTTCFEYDHTEGCETCREYVVAAFLASPEAAEGLARALHEVGIACPAAGHDEPLDIHMGQVAAILAAWLRATQDGSPGQERAK